MKQYLSPEQTAKLIELGFMGPVGSWETSDNVYSIGELMAMIPPSYSDRWKGDCYLTIKHDSTFWFVGYIVSGARKPHIIVSNIEFIDALYDMILELKKEEII